MYIYIYIYTYYTFIYTTTRISLYIHICLLIHLLIPLMSLYVYTHSLIYLLFLLQDLHLLMPVSSFHARLHRSCLRGLQARTMYVLCASIAGSHAHCKFIIYTSLCASFNTLMIVLAWFCRANATADVIPLYRGRKLSGKVRACNLHAMIWRML